IIGPASNDKQAVAPRNSARVFPRCVLCQCPIPRRSLVFSADKAGRPWRSQCFGLRSKKSKGEGSRLKLLCKRIRIFPGSTAAQRQLQTPERRRETAGMTPPAARPPTNPVNQRLERRPL